jgi:AhpD family alkylhydroperoxidase
MFSYAVREFVSVAHRSGFGSRRSRRIFAPAVAAAAVCAALFISGPAPAGQAEVDATLKDIEQTLGKVPSFLHRLPKSALPSAWAEVKALQFSNETALPPKVKALISLAVSAQIPCRHCIWEDTQSAKRAGATQEEIGEAIAIAALTRHWSTIFNGLQIDFEDFKKELGGDTPAALPAK